MSSDGWQVLSSTLSAVEPVGAMTMTSFLRLISWISNTEAFDYPAFARATFAHSAREGLLAFSIIIRAVCPGLQIESFRQACVVPGWEQ